MKFAFSWCRKDRRLFRSKEKTGVSRSNDWQCKWGLASNQPYDYGADFQTMEYIKLIIVQCNVGLLPDI